MGGVGAYSTMDTTVHVHVIAMKLVGFCINTDMT